MESSPDVVLIHRRDSTSPCLRASVRDPFRDRTSKLTGVVALRSMALFDHFSHGGTKTRRRLLREADHSAGGRVDFRLFFLLLLTGAKQSDDERYHPGGNDVDTQH